MIIDRKFRIMAICHVHQRLHDENEGVYFKAGDLAFNNRVLEVYIEECRSMGADELQIEAAKRLKQDVEMFKIKYPEKCKVPDVEPGELKE